MFQGKNLGREQGVRGYRLIQHVGWERRQKVENMSVLQANRRSLRRAEGRLFDCASRGETARGSAQEDNFFIFNHFYIPQSLPILDHVLFSVTSYPQSLPIQSLPVL